MRVTLFLRVTLSGLDESALVRLMLHSVAPEEVAAIHGGPDLPAGIGPPVGVDRMGATSDSLKAARGLGSSNLQALPSAIEEIKTIVEARRIECAKWL